LDSSGSYVLTVIIFRAVSNNTKAIGCASSPSRDGKVIRASGGVQLDKKSRTSRTSSLRFAKVLLKVGFAGTSFSKSSGSGASSSLGGALFHIHLSCYSYIFFITKD
jgi:hypothetical protein